MYIVEVSLDLKTFASATDLSLKHLFVAASLTAKESFMMTSVQYNSWNKEARFVANPNALR